MPTPSLAAATARFTEIEKFCRHSVECDTTVHLLAAECSGRFTHTPTAYEYDEWIQQMASELFDGRPATYPYVTVFLAYIVHVHRERPTIPKDRLISAAARVLAKTTFEPAPSVRWRPIVCATVILFLYIYNVIHYHLRFYYYSNHGGQWW